MSEPIPIEVNTSKAERMLDQLVRHARMTERSVLNTVKKSYRALALTADIFGIVIPEYYTLAIESLFMMAEMTRELAMAETLTGWMAVKAYVTYTLATVMFFRALQLQKQKSAVEGKLNSILQLTNTLASL